MVYKLIFTLKLRWGGPKKEQKEAVWCLLMRRQHLIFLSLIWNVYVTGLDLYFIIHKKRTLITQQKIYISHRTLAIKKWIMQDTKVIWPATKEICRILRREQINGKIRTFLVLRKTDNTALKLHSSEACLT